MIDFLIPVQYQNLELMDDCLDRIASNTGVPYKVIVIVDGGPRKGLDNLVKRMAALSEPWKLLHNATPVFLNNSIREAMEECGNKLVAYIAPHIRIDDPNWVAKVRQIFDRDPMCGVVVTRPNTKSRTLHPVRLASRFYPDPGCGFTILDARLASNAVPSGMVDPVTHWIEATSRLGKSAWMAAGVGYFEVQHKEHELWRAPLEGKAERSKSPSQTTQDSSSRMTTVRGGSVGSNWPDAK